MDDIYSNDVMGEVQEVCRRVNQDRLENTPNAAELRERYFRNSLTKQGYSRDAIDDMFAYAMGQILHEDIERALSSE